MFYSASGGKAETDGKREARMSSADLGNTNLSDNADMQNQGAFRRLSQNADAGGKLTGGGISNGNGGLLMSRKETAIFIGISLTTLDSLDIPKTRVSHRVFYRREIIIKWLAANTEKAARGGSKWTTT